jgi:hypothetical protein
MTEKFLIYDLDNDKYWWTRHLDTGWSRSVTVATQHTTYEAALRRIKDEHLFADEDAFPAFLQVVKVYIP